MRVPHAFFYIHCIPYVHSACQAIQHSAAKRVNVAESNEYHIIADAVLLSADRDLGHSTRYVPTLDRQQD